MELLQLHKIFNGNSIRACSHANTHYRDKGQWGWIELWALTCLIMTELLPCRYDGKLKWLVILCKYATQCTFKRKSYLKGVVPGLYYSVSFSERDTSLLAWWQSVSQLNTLGLLDRFFSKGFHEPSRWENSLNPQRGMWSFQTQNKLNIRVTKSSHDGSDVIFMTETTVLLQREDTLKHWQSEVPVIYYTHPLCLVQPRCTIKRDLFWVYEGVIVQFYSFLSFHLQVWKDMRISKCVQTVTLRTHARVFK